MKIFTILSLTILFSLTANASEKIVLVGKYNGDSVKLRWLPKDRNLNYTYDLYRSEQGKKDEKLIASLKKMRGDEAEAFLPKKYEGVKAFLYPLSDAKTKEEKMKVIAQAEKIIDFQLIMADHDILFAQALGIGYIDKRIEKNKNYTYFLKVYDKKKKKITEKSITILTNNASNLLPVDAVEIYSKLTGVGIKWKYFNQYSSYNIYRSDKIKGKYIKLNSQPVTINYKIDKHGVVDAPPYFFIDDTLKNYKTYYYKVTGIDYFGDESPMSLTQIGAKLKPRPKALEMKKPMIVVYEDKIVISWEKLTNKKLKHFDIFRSYKSDADFKKLNKKPLKDQIFTDKDVLEKISHFYVIIGYYSDGTIVKSVPVLGIPWDNTAPSSPTNVKAVSKPGEISITWNPIKDKSLLGYRVFRCFNPKKDSWHMLGKDIINKEFIVDKLPKAQDKEYYYYKVIALDKNQNISKPSKIIKVLLPDVTAPTRPTIKSQSIVNNYIYFSWSASTSKDTVGYNIYKRIKGKIEKINKKPLNTLEYKDSDIKAGINVAYAVSAVDEKGNESDKSDWISLAFVDKIAPKIDEITIKQEAKKITIEFSSSDKDLSGFAVFRSKDNDFFERYGSYIKNVKFFEDTKIKPNTVYFYYINLYDTSGNIVRSKTVSIETEKLIPTKKDKK